MLTITDLIAVISLCATFFSLGYMIGRNSKTKKITAPFPDKIERLFFNQFTQD